VNATESHAGRPALASLAVILSVSAVLAYGYYRTIDRPYVDARRELHEEIVRGEAPEPYRFRILAPMIAETFRRALAPAAAGEWAFLIAYAVFDLAALALFLWMLFCYVRTWFGDDQSLIGVLFAAATMGVALRDHYFQPWSLLEPALFTAGLYCIHRGRRGALAAIAAVASLNRETGVFIPFAYLIAGRSSGSGQVGGRRGAGGVVFGAALFAIWAAVFFGLRRMIGRAEPVGTVADILAYNLTAPVIARATIRGALVFGVFWLFAALGLRRAPGFVRRTALIVPLYLIPVALWGGWHETRLLLPLDAVIVPLALSFLYRQRAPAA
jgi:hypothetical protein